MGVGVAVAVLVGVGVFVAVGVLVGVKVFVAVKVLVDDGVIVGVEVAVVPIEFRIGSNKATVCPFFEKVVSLAP